MAGSARVPRTGDGLKTRRARLKLTQAELAKKLGCSQGRISQLENSGKSELPAAFRDQLRAWQTGKRLTKKQTRDAIRARPITGSPPTDGPGLKRLRKSLGLTQSELGKRLGYAQPTLSLLENGAEALPPGLVLALKRQLAKSEGATPPHSARSRCENCRSKRVRTGSGLRKLLDHLEQHEVSRSEVAAGCGIRETSLKQYETLPDLPIRFRRKLGAFLRV